MCTTDFVGEGDVFTKVKGHLYFLGDFNSDLDCSMRIEWSRADE